MDEATVKVLRELIKAARPFTDGDIVDETSGTVDLMDRLESAIRDAETLMRCQERHGG